MCMHLAIMSDKIDTITDAHIHKGDNADHSTDIRLNKVVVYIKNGGDLDEEKWKDKVQ